MERASRPRRIFENNIMVPYDIIPAMGSDIIKRYKIQSNEHETILYYEEIAIQKKKEIWILVVTDIRIIKANVINL